MRIVQDHHISRLLQCMSPKVARSGGLLRRRHSVANGAKRTFRGRRSGDTAMVIRHCGGAALVFFPGIRSALRPRCLAPPGHKRSQAEGSPSLLGAPSPCRPVKIPLVPPAVSSPRREPVVRRSVLVGSHRLL